MNKKTAIGISILYCILIIIYAYSEMNALGKIIQASSLLATSKFLIVLLTIYYGVIGKGLSLTTSFSRYWILWILWLIIDFTILQNNDGNFSSMHSFFAPSCFLLVFYLCVRINVSIKYLSIGFLLLFLITGTETFYLSITYNNLDFTTAGEIVSNLVFWPLCTFVFVPLVKKSIMKYLLFISMVVLVLLTAKRSATIIIALEIIVFAYYELVNRKKGMRSQLVFIVAAAFSVSFLFANFGNFFDATLDRFYSIHEDQGSGRVSIYEKTENDMTSFSLLELLFGKGYGSFSRSGISSNAHNDALQIMYEYGFVGLAFYVVLIFFLFYRLKKVRQYANDYYMGYIFCIITIVVLGLFSNLIPFNSYFAFICSYLGMTEAVIFRNKKKASLTIIPNV